MPMYGALLAGPSQCCLLLLLGVWRSTSELSKPYKAAHRGHTCRREDDEEPLLGRVAGLIWPAAALGDSHRCQATGGMFIKLPVPATGTRRQWCNVVAQWHSL